MILFQLLTVSVENIMLFILYIIKHKIINFVYFKMFDHKSLKHISYVRYNAVCGDVTMMNVF